MRRGVRPTLPVLPAAPAELRAVLLDWWDATRRDLPWRARPGERPDPWAVLTSEVMLQQTTAATVAGRFPAFFARFPSPSALARAELEEVLHAWQGLGYYRRARALHACAQAIETGHGGRVPDDPAALRRLPGLGPYTVAAVAAIAFDRPMVPVDGNVVRVGTRLLGLQLEPGAARTRVAEALAPLGLGPRPGDLAQALMELGALVCRPRGPDCAACPWRDPCRARASGAPDRLEDFWGELLTWADVVMAAGSLSFYRRLVEAIRIHRLVVRRGLAQVLYPATFLCGIGACLACAADVAGGRRRVCLRGPVFDLTDVVETG
jgi:A/G-specific adenine glycosylase